MNSQGVKFAVKGMVVGKQITRVAAYVFGEN